MNIQPGDPVELVLYDGQRLPDAKVVSVQPAGAILDEERALFVAAGYGSRLEIRPRLCRKAYTITLDREVDHADGQRAFARPTGSATVLPSRAAISVSTVRAAS